MEQAATQVEVVALEVLLELEVMLEWEQELLPRLHYRSAVPR